MNMVTKSASKKRVPSTVAAGEFKAKCLKLMDRVESDGTSITITKRGRPVALLSPVRSTRISALGFAREEIEIVGDITGPIDIVWEAAT